jgi:DNA polymerase-1
MSGKTLAEGLWKDLRIKITEEEADEYLARFFRKYPGVKKYIEETIAFVERFHYTYTFTGRRRRFPIAKYSRGQRARMGRQGVNARIQTTSNDLVQTNIADLSEAIKVYGGRSRIILTVHDSIGFQLPKGATGVQQMLDRVIMQNIAEKFPWLPVPWAYDVGKGPTYGEAKYDIV